MGDGRDRIYAQPGPETGDFAFDETVATVFGDMIRRSVPGYGTVVAMTGLLAGVHARPRGRCYDLGCSLGATTLAMRRHVTADGSRIVAVDNSPAMIRRCRENVSRTQGAPVDLVCADIRDLKIRSASVVALNFVLQFLPPSDRDGLIGRIHEGLLAGGALILSEKVAAPDQAEQDLFDNLHHAFKRANGYSDLEISRKRAALERVLVPETLETHRRRLRRAGFRQVSVWMHCLNFASLLALR